MIIIIGSNRNIDLQLSFYSGLPFVRDNNHNCRLWTAHSAACLPQTNQPQSVACLVGFRLVGIDPHPVRGLMMWSWICEVTLWWMLTTQSILLVSNTSLSRVEGQRTLVIEHRLYLLIAPDSFERLDCPSTPLVDH